MNFTRILVIFGALVLATTGILIVNNLTEKNQVHEEKTIKTVLVLVATTDLLPGVMVTPEKMTWKEWPIKSINKQYFVKNQSKDLKDLEESVVRYPIFEGEPITHTNIIKPGGRSVLAAVIHPGMRAVTVPYSRITNAPALIAPGDVIDVIIPKRGQDKSDPEEFVGQTILHALRVLAVDNSLQNTTDDHEGGGPKTLTLEVSVQQAEELAGSIREGQIIISMRSVFAGQEIVTEPHTKSEDVKIEVKNDSEFAKNKPERAITVFHGSNRNEINVK